MRRPKGVLTTAYVTIKTKNGTTCFSGAKRYNPRPAPFSSISFPARGKRYGPRSGGDGAADRTAPGAFEICRLFSMWERSKAQVRKNTPIPARRRPRDESIADTSWCHPGSEGKALPFSALTGRSPAISARSAPYTLARRMSFALCTAGAFQQTAPSLSGARRYCFRVTAYSFFQRMVFFVRIIIRQSRSPRCRPRISISAEARLVAQGTL